MPALLRLFLLLPLWLSANAFATESRFQQAELGRYLFHDVRLSEKGNRSCALCHNPDIHWTNTFQKVPDIDGRITTLNTPSLLNVAFNDSHTLSTYGVHSLEQAVERPLLSKSPLEMGATKSLVLERLKDAENLYAPLFSAAYGNSQISYHKALEALAAFVATITSQNTPYHRYLAGDTTALSQEALAGKALFESARLNCISCHSGPWLNQTQQSGKVEYYNVGLYGIEGGDGHHYYPANENGLRKSTALAADDGRYRTASLINVSNTGPWGHDGSFAQLEDVLDSYARGGRLITLGENAGDGKLSFAKHASIKGFALADTEKNQLLAFFDALSIEDNDALRVQTQSPFCQLVPLKNRTETQGCIEPFRVSPQ